MENYMKQIDTGLTSEEVTQRTEQDQHQRL